MKTCENEFCDQPARPDNRNGRPGRFCGAACRREAANLAWLRQGKPIKGYATVDAYLGRRRRRANSLVKV